MFLLRRLGSWWGCEGVAGYEANLEQFGKEKESELENSLSGKGKGTWGGLNLTGTNWIG